MHALAALTRLAEAIAARRSLEELLQLVADGAAEVLEVERISVRLLDAGRTMLLASARAGAPLHEGPVGFRLGEGLLGWIAEHGQPLCLPEPERDPRFLARPGMAPMGAFVGVPIVRDTVSSSSSRLSPTSVSVTTAVVCPAAMVNGLAVAP